MLSVAGSAIKSVQVLDGPRKLWVPSYLEILLL